MYVEAPEICVKCGDVGTWVRERELDVEEATKVVGKIKEAATAASTMKEGKVN